MNKLTEILDQYSIVRYDNINGINAASETDWYELQNELLAWVAEVIGEDDNIGIDPSWPWSKEAHRDQLRAEQRKRAGL